MLAYARPLTETLAALRSGQQDLQEHIVAVCERIEQIEGRLQALESEGGRLERLLRQAAALQEQFSDPGSRPPLYGVLVGVKDIFHVDGLVTRGGTALPNELFAGEEAASVAALRRAGALFLGKTVTTEFAYMEPGPTCNPHNLGHTPGGSSSGSAAAVAAGYCLTALGSQTVGSVIRPAAFCGIVGLKPSYDRIETQGILYFSRSVDTVGVYTQDVAGMGQVAGVVCAEWRAGVEVDRPVLGVVEGPYLQQASEQALAAFERQLGQLQEAGFALQRVRILEDIEDINERHQQLTAAEFAQVHAAWFDEYEALYRPRTAALIRHGREVSGAVVEKGRAGRAALRQQLAEQMTTHGVDMWVCPSATGTAPAGLNYTGDPCMNLPWTHAGLPALNVPAGRAANGLPLGLQCCAAAGQDEELLAWGGMLEEVLRHR